MFIINKIDSSVSNILWEIYLNVKKYCQINLKLLAGKFWTDFKELKIYLVKMVA